MSKSPYIGTGVAVITPFNSSLEVDYQSLRQLINHLIENDIDYLVAMGTTAESSTISVEEKKQIFDCFIETTANRVPLVMGLGGNNTAALAQSLQQVDTKGFLLYYQFHPITTDQRKRGFIDITKLWTLQPHCHSYYIMFLEGLLQISLLKQH